jgi:hypothetical protein
MIGSIADSLAQSQQPGAHLRPTVRQLTRACVEQWWATDCSTPLVGPLIPAARQSDNAREAERLMDELAVAVEGWPADDEDRRRVRDRLQARVRRFGAECLGWPEGYQTLLLADEFVETTRAFVQQARAFAPAVPPDDVLQALRNVWIANSLQMLLDRPVRLSSSVFGYSLLYPYTDNYLDDPGVPADRKAAFNDALARRLAGEPCAARDGHDRDVFALVEMIEAEHPRAARPGVYASLLAIQRAQVASLQQQVESAPYEIDLLALSVEKGGTSVLADAWLVAGTLEASEAEFAFGYGVFLQLLDDLQDARRDREAGHMTVFSQAAGRWPLDRLASRLWRLIGHLVDGPRRFAGPQYAERRDLIRRNCTLLLVGAVAENPDFFSRPFIEALERRWPIDFAALRRLRRTSATRYARTRERLQQRGIGGLLDLLA